MAIYINIYYTGKNGNARKFAEEMMSSGIVDAIRAENGNICYDYFFPMNDKETLLLIDAWENQKALDIHHETPMMSQIAELREKYNLTMKVERFSPDNDSITENDRKYIKNRL
ncbi:MAG: antibiotic biosynthesis monooxygenase [Ruminococcus sp.]|nr:antibiotic biosynthesis monooxygenase [Ruminococcus sp.]